MKKNILPTNNRFAILNKTAFNLKGFNRLSIFLIVVLSVLFIVGINNLSIQGYVLSDLKEQRNKLAGENKKLELKAVNLISYNNVSEKIASLKMVAVESIDYLNTGAELVAKK